MSMTHKEWQDDIDAMTAEQRTKLISAFRTLRNWPKFKEHCDDHLILASFVDRSIIEQDDKEHEWTHETPVGTL